MPLYSHHFELFPMKWTYDFGLKVILSGDLQNSRKWSCKVYAG